MIRRYDDGAIIYYGLHLERFEHIDFATGRELPVKSIKKLCSFISVVFGLRERFLTAISRIIVAGGHSHQPLITT
jgi:hypothetical protein